MKLVSDARAISLLGVPVVGLTMDEAVASCEQTIRERGQLLLGVVNAAKLVNMHRDPELGDAVRAADLILADGMSVVWASRVLGRSLPQRVAGIDLMVRLLERASECGYRVYCLGATDEVLEEVTRQIKRDYPGAKLVGTRNGYFDSDEEPTVAQAIADAKPDMLFVAMTSPKKEQFLARWAQRMETPVCHGVGGAFDVMAGKVKRAPERWQRLGLEWLYRVVQEPRRMWRRYLITNTLFCGMVLREAFTPTWLFARGAPQSDSTTPAADSPCHDRALSMKQRLTDTILNRSSLAVFLTVFLLGVFLLAVATPVFSHSLQAGLMDEYDAIAENLVVGHTYSASEHHRDLPTVTRGPAYPLYMAAIFEVFGVRNYAAVRVFDMLLHALAAALLAAAVRRLASPKSAILAGLLYALWPTTLYYVGKGCSETMLCFWFVLGLYALVRFHCSRNTWWVLLLGLALGLGCLTRGSAVVPTAIAGLWLLIWWVRRHISIRPAVVLVATWTVVMTPWWVRNYQLTGQFVPFHSLLWYNAYEDDILDSRLLWLESQGLIHADLQDVDPRTCPAWVVDYPEGFKYPSGLHATDDLAQEARYQAIVTAKMANHTYLAKKMLRNSIDFWSKATTVFKTRALMVTSTVWLALFYVGLRFGIRDPSVRWFVLSCLAVTLLTWGLYLAICGVFRYSVPLTPFIAATVGVGWSARSYRATVAPAPAVSGN